MSGPSTRRVIGAGAVAGLAGGLAMVVLWLVLRVAIGIPLPVELISDRVIPMLPIGRFLHLAAKLGGLEAAKGRSFLASLIVAAVLGSLGGVLAALAARRTSLARAAAMLAAVLSLIWALGLVLLWPVLAANFAGIGPGWARVATIATLAVEFGVYLAVTGGVLRWLLGKRPGAEIRQAGLARAGDGSISRRAALAGAGLGVLAVAAGGLTELVRRRATFPPYGYDGRSVHAAHVEPVTPVDRFYVVTKNILDPRVDAGLWRLRIEGQVRQPGSYRLDELRTDPALVERAVTLECISNPVGGGLISNAVWRGVPLAELVRRAGVDPGARILVLEGVDGYVHTLSLGRAMDRDTLLAVEMNGEPLTSQHGYPARLLVPGAYGENSVKWIERVEATDRAVEGYYERQGWVPWHVRTMSRIDRPAPGTHLPSGRPVEVGGVAFAGDRGISRVEVSDDDGATWRPTTIGYAPNPTTWALWSTTWRPDRTGRAAITVRATDGTGEVQPASPLGPPPSGSQGYHRIEVRVA